MKLLTHEAKDGCDVKLLTYSPKAHLCFYCYKCQEVLIKKEIPPPCRVPSCPNMGSFWEYLWMQKPPPNEFKKKFFDSLKLNRCRQIVCLSSGGTEPTTASLGGVQSSAIS
jgi:hypothetical protein